MLFFWKLVKNEKWMQKLVLGFIFSVPYLFVTFFQPYIAGPFSVFWKGEIGETR